MVTRVAQWVVDRLEHMARECVNQLKGLAEWVRDADTHTE